MAEITFNGYKIKNQNAWFAEERDMYLSIDPNWNLDPSSPDGLKLAADAETFANLDETLQQAYNSKDPNKAQDLDLDIVCSLTGTTRSPGTPSNVPLTINGVQGTVILAGDLVESTVDGTQWKLDENVTIGVGGTVSTTATCTTLGSITASIGTITRIVKTVGGWQGVTNLSPATLGTNRQNNSSLRIERRQAVSKPGNNQVDNMLGEIFGVENVTRARVYENDTNTDNFYGRGLPKNSIAPIVVGGTDADVALAIFRKKNPGCKLHSSGTPVTVLDVFDKYPSNTKDITFSRPIDVPIIITVSIVSDGSLPNDAEQQIKDAILAYARGDLVAAECGFNVLGFDIGEDVPVSRLSTPVNQVIGKYGNSYLSGLTVNTLTYGAIVPVAFNELATFTEGNVTVSIV